MAASYASQSNFSRFASNAETQSRNPSQPSCNLCEDVAPQAFVSAPQEEEHLALWNSFLIAFSVLLPLINPFGSALVFLGLVGDAPPELIRSLARRIAINNIIFLAIIEALGATILNFFGISLPIVQLGGGFIITAIAWGLLNEKSAAASSKDKEEETGAQGAMRNKRLEEGAFYPFTFPITSGPGTLVGMLTLGAHSSGRALTTNILSHIGVFIAVIVLSVLCYYCYAYAPRLTRAISPSTAHGILRVIAFILFCIGVQIAWNGLSALVIQIIRP
jgi:multiple antibiotic resistance protein